MFSNNSSRKLGWGQLFLTLLLVTVVLMVSNIDDVYAKGLYKTRGSLFKWDDNWHPPRAEARLNWMGQWSETLSSRLQGVCYDMLEEKDRPYYVYLGMGFQNGSLLVEPTLGWSFRDMELVGALRTYPKGEGWRAYTNLEYQLETKTYYYLAQAEFYVNPLIEWGVELEGWGDIDDKLMSNGAGINLAFHLRGLSRYKHQDSKLRVEAFVQLREMDGEYKPQFGVRFEFTPKQDEHTPNRKRYR